MSPIIPKYRFVYDRVKGKGYVTSRIHGYDATLSKEAMELLMEASSISSPANALIKRALEFEWLTSTLSLNGSLSCIERAPHLKRVQIETTLRCNLRCSYCYSESGPAKNTELNVQDILTVISDAAALGCIFIDFTGGEILLYPSWKAVFQHAAEYGLVITVHTNGTGMNDRNLDYLAEIGVRRLQVSLDSCYEAVHDRSRGVPGAFSKTIKAIRTAQRKAIPVRLSVVLHQDNKNHIEEIVQWASHELQVPIALDRVIPAGGELTANKGIQPKEFYELVAPLISRDVVSSRVCEPVTVNDPHTIEPECGIGQSFVYITAQGEIALCPTMTSRDSPIFSGPNLKQTSLKEAWLDSPYFDRYRFLNCENVTRCPAAKACGGGCRSNAYLDHGTLTSPDTVSCNLHKNMTSTFVDFHSRYSRNDYSTIP